jgi:carbamate kinase
MILVEDLGASETLPLVDDVAVESTSIYLASGVIVGGSMLPKVTLHYHRECDLSSL